MLSQTSHHTTPDIAPHVVEFRGPEEIIQAIDCLLGPEEPTIVVVRGLVAAIGTRLSMYNNPLNAEAELHTAVPRLSDSRTRIKNYWGQQGYRGYTLANDGNLLSNGIREGGMAPHTDYSISAISRLAGPVSLSLGLFGTAQYYAQKPPDSSHRNPLTGTLDIVAWHKWKRTPLPKCAGLAVSTLQRAGDGIFFLNHPRQAAHAIDASRSRAAILFDNWTSQDTAS